ncbi:MAG: tetratricopeptide repeat protein [Rhizobiales bacterium]|nr:tetratricopeptide repeat protein [Hyphomicrobiales bacterium]MDQ3558290.1 adenylate/guanylate cyclase domain-containing protein [Pseudomonadota bacterium]
MAAVLSADLVGFSLLVAHSEEETLQRLSEQRRSIIDPLLARHNGRLFKTMGDGLLVEFASALDAVRYAVAHQSSMAESQAEIAPTERLVWRMAIHLGDVVVDGDDLVGDGVNVASRLQALAPPGGVLVSQTIRDHLPDSFALKPAGSPHLKNIPRPLQVFEVLGGGSVPPSRGRRRHSFAVLRRPTTRLALVAATAGLIGLGVWAGGSLLGLPWLRPFFLQGATEVEEAPPRILVTPLTTGSEESREVLLAGGLTDELIGGLSKFSGLQVFGRNTSDSLAEADLSPAELLDQHGIRYVVSGTLRMIDETFRLNFELTDTSTGATRWAERYEENLGGTFEALDTVVAKVVSQVAAKVSRAELDATRQRPPANLTAFELTLRGRQLWQRPSRENIVAARAVLEQAIKADPAFPPPLAYLAFTYLTGYNNKWSDDYEDSAALNRMLDLSGRALELDPDFATAYAAQAIAYTYLGRHDEAASAAARAVEANPNDPDVLGRAAQVLSFSGRHEDAIAMLARAIELDPFGPAQWFNFLSRAHFFLGRYDAALAAARTCLDRAKLQPCRETLAAALALSGELDSAATEWRQLTEADSAISPEKMVARLRPAFRRQSDLDRLVEALDKAAAHRIGVPSQPAP